ncbi:MAG: 3-dehydroquinate synthase, partial [Synergistaceae bacterium]|nr:3-dehydroquinate synthase [Synergistaceae bacterium]
SPADSCAVVADEMTASLFGGSLGSVCQPFLLPRGEEGKTLSSVAKIYSFLGEHSVDRSGTLLALGGGAVGDAAGFAAATWLRGIRLVQCPTTLLAQVDSSIGGKTGVNLPEGKNLVGAFHPAEWVFADIDCLASQKDEDFRQGLAEVVKYGAGEDWGFFSWLEENALGILRRSPSLLEEVVGRCAGMKLAVAARDERERRGVRARLNLGHTVGHALEAAGGYETWKHGDGVAAGMMVVFRLACRLGELDEGHITRLERLLKSFGLPTRPDRPWNEIVPFLLRDKKNLRGSLRLVIPRRGTSCELRRDISLPLLREAYEKTALKGEGTPCALDGKPL